MINTWNESLLHEELKDIYCGELGKKEVEVEGSICDAVREDQSIVEIQTRNLSKLKPKLDKLLLNHRVNLVYPIALTTRLETWTPEQTLKSARKSPKKGVVFQLFDELTGIYPLLGHRNLTLTVVFADVLEIRMADGTGSWRRKGIRIEDRKLLKIHESRAFTSLSDLDALIPPTLPFPFTVQDLNQAGVGHHAGKMAWVLRKCGLLTVVGKKGRAFLYDRPSGQNR